MKTWRLVNIRHVVRPQYFQRFVQRVVELLLDILVREVHVNCGSFQCSITLAAQFPQKNELIQLNRKKT